MNIDKMENKGLKIFLILAGAEVRKRFTMGRLSVTMPKSRQRGKGLLLLALGMAVAILLCGARTELFAEAADRPFRLAITSSLFTDVNENDIRAALKVWVATFAREQGISVDPDPHMHQTAEDLIRFAQANTVDAFGLTTPEYATLSREVPFDLLATGTIGGQIEVVYLLLVRQESGLERLDQLAGRNINIIHNPRMSLATTWLDVALLEAKLRRASDFFGQITLERKVSQVLLPVFFGTVDACLVTQESFEVMSDLNPQLKKQLRILSTSPPVVPVALAFRRDSTSPHRQQVLEAMVKLEDSPAGQQILELSQSETVEVHSISCLDESLELIKKHQQLLNKD